MDESWPNFDRDWAEIQEVAEPVKLNKFGYLVSKLIIPEIGNPETDLRSLSIREWAVELLWELKNKNANQATVTPLIRTPLSM